MTFGTTFMQEVYDHIKHGDEAHMKWLKDKCEELAPILDARLIEKDQTSTNEHEDNYPSVHSHRVR